MDPAPEPGLACHFARENDQMLLKDLKCLQFHQNPRTCGLPVLKGVVLETSPVLGTKAPQNQATKASLWTQSHWFRMFRAGLISIFWLDLICPGRPHHLILNQIPRHIANKSKERLGPPLDPAHMCDKPDRNSQLNLFARLMSRSERFDSLGFARARSSIHQRG